MGERDQACAGTGSSASGSRSAGPGVSTAPAMTAAKPTSRATSAAVPSGSGSPNTIGPAAIVTTLAAALVIAMTATAGPSCSERAETTRPTSDRIVIDGGLGREQDEQAVVDQVARAGLDRHVAAAPQQAGGDGQHRARAARVAQHGGAAGDGRDA